ncbi:MAG: ATP-grasp domain-containing protein [Corynebacterium sp.]|nr:ATP-grasp domain-containing protein [Corynebacterium sp.]
MLVPEYLAPPNQSDSTRVLILGECSLAVSLANAFESLGAFVTMLGKHNGIDDPKVLQEIVARFNPTYIVPASDDISIDALQQLHAHSDVEIVPSSKFIEQAYDRERIYRVARYDLGLPTPRFRCASSAEEAAEQAIELGFPCIARAVENTGEGHSFMVNNAGGAESAWEKLATNRIILERVVEYDYAMTIVVVRSIDPETSKLATWFCQPIGKVLENDQLVGAFQPLVLERGALDNAHSVAARITNAIGGRGIFSVDLFVAGEDVYFSGLSAHPKQAGAVTDVSQRIGHAMLHARAVLGLPIDVTLTSPGAVRVSQAADTHVSQQAVAQALTVPEAGIRFTRGGLIYITATADTATEAYQRAVAAQTLLGLDAQAEDAALGTPAPAIVPPASPEAASPDPATPDPISAAGLGNPENAEADARAQAHVADANLVDAPIADTPAQDFATANAEPDPTTASNSLATEQH